MTHVAHDLHSEFPNDVEILHQLKMSNHHYQKLADTYRDVNREIHRIESGIEAASDARLEGLKKQRLAMLDEVTGMIRKARQG